MSRDSKHLPKSVLLEETGSPAIIRLAVLFSVLVLVSFLYWGNQTKIGEVATAPGQMAPQGNVQKIQHLNGGVMDHLAVEEGQTVEQGQLLLTLKIPITRAGIEFFESVSIHAPVKGTVHKLKATTAGEVVTPGETLLELVPFGILMMAEIHISPRDIGHIVVGEPVTLKFMAYDFARYGGISGTLVKLSATTFNETGKEPYYKGWVKPTVNYIGKDPTVNPLLPGMTLLAEVKTGEKSILEYLLKPIFTSASEAMRER